jgi:indolepyruvate ferredoxin oxidoreductase alpha subunit
MKEAFQVSEQFDIPVLFRVTTRVCHSKSLVEPGVREEVTTPEYRRNARKFVCTPANAKLNHPILEQKLKDLAAYSNQSPLNKVEMKGTQIGVITASILTSMPRKFFRRILPF